MLNSSQVRCGALLAMLFVAATVSSAAAQRVSASAVDTEVSVQNSVALVKFSIAITNNEDAPIAGLTVVFSDGIQLFLGDVAPDATIKSQPENRTLDTGEFQSRSIPVNVTLKFTLEGEAVELPWILNVARPE